MTEKVKIKKYGSIKIGARIIRAFFNGIAVGLLAGFAILLIAKGINLQAMSDQNLFQKILGSQQPISEMAYFFTVFGAFVAASLGIEFSKDIDEAEEFTAELIQKV